MPISRNCSRDWPARPTRRWQRRFAPWVAWCKERHARYPVVLPEYRKKQAPINPYCFMDRLSDHLPADAAVVCGDATACITAFQTLRLKRGQRLYSNSGSASMGYDLPAAIGAAWARTWPATSSAWPATAAS